MPEKVIASLGDREITIETGKLAKQANGAVTLQMGETVIMVAVCAAPKAKPGQDFFPLQVDYREKAAAAGQIPGSYFKREGRPSEKEILTMRMTDRPIRPLFPKGMYNEVQVQSLLLSADGENDSDILSILGASAALMVSNIPWAGPLGAVRVGRVDGKFIANPTHTEMADSDIDLVFVGTDEEMVMFEGAADEIPDDDFKAALRFGQEACKPLIAAQRELAEKAGKEKMEIELQVVSDDILNEARTLVGDRLAPALLTPGKKDREDACKAIEEETATALSEKFGEDAIDGMVVGQVFYQLQKETVRKLILNDSKRQDGRAFDDIRQLTSEVGVLPRTHGSAIFTRGETQALSQVTLGTKQDNQHFDSYTGGPSDKSFILHYNFPNYSVGETGRIMGPGRREIGHGALAERSIAPVVPTDELPYTIRVTSEIMESNGSTSMASVCGGSLALLDAGIPLKRPVAGISIGLCTESDDSGKIVRHAMLTDIIGWEDAYCDMDCKIAGTEKGITGFQLDLKLKGIPFDLMDKALDRARESRLVILENMHATISEARKEMSPYAPQITKISVPTDKIGALIGPGGKNIKRIVEESGCEINIEEDGTVIIYSVGAAGLEIARNEIEGITAVPEVGKIYRGKVVSTKDFGCFVEFLPGQDGLCHISELANFRVKATEDIVKSGDEIWVKLIGIDEKGRVKLSRKAAMEERDGGNEEESAE